MNILVSLILFSLIIISLFTYSFEVGFKSIVALVLGYTVWLCSEYLFHRYLFHFKALPKKVKKYLSNGHKFHHRYPQTTKNLALPITLTLPFSLIYLGVYSYVFGLEYAFWFYFGLVCGLFLYELIHYLNHHSLTNFKPLKYLRTHHEIHHFTDTDSNFTVSNPILDLLFKSKRK